MCLDIHLHHTLHHTFAFINIHLDIHRIIIIITQAVASALKIRLRQKEKEAVFMLRCVRKEGKVFFAFGSKMLISFTPKHFIHLWEGRNILQATNKVHQEKFNYKIYYKKFLELFLQSSIQASSVLVELQLRHSHPLKLRRHLLTLQASASASSSYTN